MLGSLSLRECEQLRNIRLHNESGVALHRESCTKNLELTIHVWSLELIGNGIFRCANVARARSILLQRLPRKVEQRVIQVEHEERHLLVVG